MRTGIELRENFFSKFHYYESHARKNSKRNSGGLQQILQGGEE